MGFKELSLPESYFPGIEIPENGVESYCTIFAFECDNVRNCLIIGFNIFLSPFRTF